MMRDEYDFSKGVRGKHYKAYREGHPYTFAKAMVQPPFSILRKKKVRLCWIRISGYTFPAPNP